MTLQEFAALLAERGYGYALKPTIHLPELESHTEVFAVRGRWEMQYLGSTELVLQQSVEQFRQSWGYQRLGISREAYLQRTAKEVADFVLDQAGAAHQAYTPWAQEITPRLLGKLLFELEEAGYLINRPPIYGKASETERKDEQL
ncbi:MAG TPA: hypothetical protein VFV38_08980 [Ktedonobacteraceae bacterium]|nr:hypothetical protein [Ktedonobacteraceae bacterium]